MQEMPGEILGAVIDSHISVSNSAESHGYIKSLLIGLFLPRVWSNSGF